MKNQNVENLTDCFREATSLNVTFVGNEVKFDKGNDKYQMIIDSLYKITEYSHVMPAFGVCLDEPVKQEKQTGIWLELNFEKVLSFNDMPFESLLIKVESEACGFNLMRKNNGKYEGRCFYLSLETSMTELAETIKSLSCFS